MNERLKRSLTPSARPPQPYPQSTTNVRKEGAQKPVGGKATSPPTTDPVIRANIQEVVGTAWARYMLHGNGQPASVVDWISEALAAKLSEEPEFFYD